MQKIILEIMIVALCWVCLAEEKTFAVMYSLSARVHQGQTKKGASEKMFYGTKSNMSKTSVLEVELRNMGADNDTFIVDYYFLCKYIGVESYRIFDYGSQFYSLGKMEAIKDEFESRPIEKQIYNWPDGDRWEFGEKAGGFIIILKDRNGKILTVRSKITKLQNIINDQAKLAGFLQQTNNIPPPETNNNRMPMEPYAPMSPASPMTPMMPQQEGHIRINISK